MVAVLILLACPSFAANATSTQQDCAVAPINLGCGTALTCDHGQAALLRVSLSSPLETHALDVESFTGPAAQFGRRAESSDQDNEPAVVATFWSDRSARPVLAFQSGQHAGCARTAPSAWLGLGGPAQPLLRSNDSVAYHRLVFYTASSANDTRGVVLHGGRLCVGCAEDVLPAHQVDVAGGVRADYLLLGNQRLTVDAQGCLWWNGTRLACGTDGSSDIGNDMLARGIPLWIMLVSLSAVALVCLMVGCCGGVAAHKRRMKKHMTSL